MMEALLDIRVVWFLVGAGIWALVGYGLYLWAVWDGRAQGLESICIFWPVFLVMGAVYFSIAVPIWIVSWPFRKAHAFLYKEAERRGRERRMGGVANEHPTATPIVNVWPTTRPHERDSQ